MGDFVVAATIELDDLGIPICVKEVSPSDFNTLSCPSRNVVLEGPSSVLGRDFEISVYDNVIS